MLKISKLQSSSMILKLQSFLEHNEFGGKPADKIEHSMLIFSNYSSN
jgi:hypothetical protein